MDIESNCEGLEGGLISRARADHFSRGLRGLNSTKQEGEARYCNANSTQSKTGRKEVGCGDRGAKSRRESDREDDQHHSQTLNIQRHELEQERRLFLRDWG